MSRTLIPFLMLLCAFTFFSSMQVRADEGMDIVNEIVAGDDPTQANIIYTDPKYPNQTVDCSCTTPVKTTIPGNITNTCTTTSTCTCTGYRRINGRTIQCGSTNLTIVGKSNHWHRNTCIANADEKFLEQVWDFFGDAKKNLFAGCLSSF